MSIEFDEHGKYFTDIVPKVGTGQVIVLIESCFELIFFMSRRVCHCNVYSIFIIIFK